MIDFLGEYEVTMDAKGRFLLPAGFKKQLAEEGAGQFVINRGIETCLSLYPIQSWEPIFSQVSKLNEFDPKVRQFRRYFLNGATHLELDSAGRLLIPKALMEYAGLEKDVVLVSAINKIEIWDKIKYTKFFESFSPESYSELANEVMNKKEEKPKS
ncbi:MAG: division/cell wall cluster transcriptional repressor MraZ [Ferruginibacter sp.]